MCKYQRLGVNGLKIVAIRPQMSEILKKRASTHRCLGSLNKQAKRPWASICLNHDDKQVQFLNIREFEHDSYQESFAILKLKNLSIERNICTINSRISRISLRSSRYYDEKT